MGQILRAMGYEDRSTEDAIEALSISGIPLLWYPRDDGIMGGKSETDLGASEDGSLHIQGTIDTNASVGWASARARLPEKGLPQNTNAISVTAQGDGKTYKVLLMDANHENRINQSPLWEADLTTKSNGVTETTVLPLASFTPSYMSRQLSPGEKKKYAPLYPSDLTKMGFMLSSKLSDGSPNPVETYGEGTFGFSLHVKAVAAVLGDK